MFRFWQPGNIILLYHRVACVESDPWSLCVTPTHFAEHMEVLQRYARVRLDQMNRAGRRFGGQPAVAVTFDDGYADNPRAAAPILKRYDTPATFFIATAYIGGSREFWWDELERVAGDRYAALYEELRPLPHQARRELLDAMLEAAGEPPHGRSANLPMTSQELDSLSAESLFEIGAHTVTHPLLSAQPAEVQRAEIQGSKTWLESLIGLPVTSLSYPYGGTEHYNETSVAAARDAGFSRACTTGSRQVTGRDNPYEWPRIAVPDMDGDQFHKFLRM